MVIRKIVLSLAALVLIVVSSMGQTYNENNRYGNGTQNDMLRMGLAGFGPATFRNVETDELAYNLYGGYLWGLNQFAVLKGIVEATTDFDDAVLAALNVGTNFYPIHHKVSPYVGATIGLTYLGGSRIDDTFGLGSRVSLGAQLFRGEATQLNLELGTLFHFREVDDELPFTYSATVGVLF